MLTHSSGLGSYWNDEFERRFKHLRELDDYLPVIKNEQLKFEPGSRMRYSNVGPLILGMIIEKVTGQTYFDYVRENIYEPAGMENTDCYEMDHPVPNLAIGYHQQWTSRAVVYVNNLFIQPIRGGPAGFGGKTQKRGDAMGSADDRGGRHGGVCGGFQESARV